MRVGWRVLSFHASKKKARKMVPAEDVKEQIEAAAHKSKAMAQTQVYMGSLGKVADDYIPGETAGGLAMRAKSELQTRVAESKIKGVSNA